jgi:hypothetical protein
MIANSPRAHPIADRRFALLDARQPAAAWYYIIVLFLVFRSESEKTKYINRKEPLCRRLAIHLAIRERCTND